MEQATSTADKVVSISATMTQLLTPRAGGHLDSMPHSLNMGDHKIGKLQYNLTGLCNVVGTLEKKMYYLSQNETAQSIKDSSEISPRNEFDV